MNIEKAVANYEARRFPALRQKQPTPRTTVILAFDAEAPEGLLTFFESISQPKE